MWTTLNFEGRSKTKKKTSWRYLQGDKTNIECERDWLVGLGATLGDGQKIKNYFSSFGDVSGESR